MKLEVISGKWLKKKKQIYNLKNMKKIFIFLRWYHNLINFISAKQKKSYKIRINGFKITLKLVIARGLLINDIMFEDDIFNQEKLQFRQIFLKVWD